VEGVGFEPTNP